MTEEVFEEVDLRDHNIRGNEEKSEERKIEKKEESLAHSVEEIIESLDVQRVSAIIAVVWVIWLKIVVQESERSSWTRK